MATAQSSPLGLMQQQRRYALYKDQHNRTWGAVIDKRTGHPVDTIQAKFDAPWYPEHQYVRILHDREMQPNMVTVHYDEAIHDLERAHQRYQEALINAGIELHGQAFDETKPTLAVLQRVGKPPKDVEPWRLAAAGNPWLLGLAEFDPTDPDHVAAARVLRRTDLIPETSTPAPKRVRKE